MDADLPAGLVYEPDIVSRRRVEMLEAIRRLDFGEVRMRGKAARAGARFRFRRDPASREVRTAVLAPRSAYVLDGLRGRSGSTRSRPRPPQGTL